MARSLLTSSLAFILRPYHRQMRGMTLGTRTAAIRDDKFVMLVRHGYAPGWMLPGGGVERGETLSEAAVRELREETGIEAQEELRLHGIFLNPQFPGDHVAVFVMRRMTMSDFKPSLEIREARFFPLDALPEGTTAGTRRRLAEITSGSVPDRHW
ncbi:NUDIX domain-containing protein [Aestuariivirga sp.]|uniref:NUDIX domain-containing protein n=1 Tax=Aestuariivirga sp. TaxID=2650926 RepID=UPI0039E53A65